VPSIFSITLFQTPAEGQDREEEQKLWGKVLSGKTFIIGFSRALTIL
jgi:hypothetical protein